MANRPTVSRCRSLAHVADNADAEADDAVVVRLPPRGGGGIQGEAGSKHRIDLEA